jgi:hypothetical protein
MLDAVRFAGLAALLVLVLAPVASAACPPATSILKSPRKGTKEVQAKALNDRGDVVGFADGRGGRFRAILWRGGKASRAVVIGVLPGYVSSEAYAINNDRVVFGLLYDRKDRTFPFRWKNGRMTLLRGTERAQGGGVGPRPQRDQRARRDRRDADQRRAPAGGALGALGQGDGAAPAAGAHLDERVEHRRERGRLRLVASAAQRGRREQPGRLVAVRRSDCAGTAAGRADGAAEATNRSGLTVGYLGNLGTETDPRERRRHGVGDGHGATAAPGPRDAAGHLRRARRRQRPRAGGGHVGHVHRDRLPTGPAGDLADRRDGATEPDRPPCHAPSSRRDTELHDINARGDIVGDAFGLSAAAFDKLQRIYPVLWTCPFGR